MIQITPLDYSTNPSPEGLTFPITIGETLNLKITVPKQ